MKKRLSPTWTSLPMTLMNLSPIDYNLRRFGMNFMLIHALHFNFIVTLIVITVQAYFITAHLGFITACTTVITVREVFITA